MGGCWREEEADPEDGHPGAGKVHRENISGSCGIGADRNFRLERGLARETSMHRAFICDHRLSAKSSLRLL